MHEMHSFLDYYLWLTLKPYKAMPSASYNDILSSLLAAIQCEDDTIYLDHIQALQAEMRVHQRAANRLQDIFDNPYHAQAAAKFGVEPLKLLRKAGFPWDKNVCYEAAMHGRLDALEYALENGCPWDERALDIAVRNEHTDIVEYCRQNGLN
jgi:hypothetical protein